ncbi:MAG: SH3 domain-containing protein [Candidatus Omnitrophica bacterium]|nr:SH3 domain-containing protein [Candidatus Omnitrophota bacterium]MBU1869120.1 SH3 domain-containing protein [Candidatus Omnitrophota bacterium]
MSKKNLIKSSIIILFLFSFCGCAANSGQRQYFSAPSVIPGTSRQMKTAGFWIAKHPYPDKIILGREGIDNFNKHVQSELRLIVDVRKVGPLFSGKELFATLKSPIASLKKRVLFEVNGDIVADSFYRAQEKQIDLEAIPEDIKVTYGFITHYADQRVFPTEEPLFAKPGDIDFDELQNSSLDVGTPVAVLHRSIDGKWIYVVGPTSSGWVKAEEVAVCPYEELMDLMNKREFAVIISPKADIFLNEGLTQYYDYAKMGSVFPLEEKPAVSGVTHVIIPQRLENGKLLSKIGYISQKDINIGNLIYTPRTIIEQAFKMLNSPYGWGGMYGEQDCSNFLQEVFATVGIILPRNSSAQAKVGVCLARFNDTSPDSRKPGVLKSKGIGGVTLLQMKGHIMLFLGMFDDKPYAIHASWAYREPGQGEDKVRVMNRVVVTDLFLGEGSKKGSLLDRVVAICNLEGENEDRASSGEDFQDQK